MRRKGLNSATCSELSAFALKFVWEGLVSKGRNNNNPDFPTFGKSDTKKGQYVARAEDGRVNVCYGGCLAGELLGLFGLPLLLQGQQRFFLRGLLRVV